MVDLALEKIKFRLMKSVEFSDDGCWLWTASLKPAGYGQMSGFGKRVTYSHRVSYRIFKGEIPYGHELDHKCRVRRCINPDHLEAVPHRENVVRGVGLTAINAAKSHCLNGHQFTAENTHLDTRNQRVCLTCRRFLRRTEEAKAKKRAWRAKRKAAGLPRM